MIPWKTRIQHKWKKRGVIYENDDIVVTHRFIDFPSGDKEAVLGVMNLKNGKGIRMETGATTMPA